MRIAIDARAMSHPQPGGFKTYVTNLVVGLLRSDPTNEYTLYVDRPLSEDRTPAYPQVSVEVIPSVCGWAGAPLREQVLLPARLRQDHPTIVHFPCSTGAVLASVPSVATIHDAIEFVERPEVRLRSAEGVRRLLMSQYNRWVQRAVARKARMILTVSAHAGADIAKVLGVGMDRIRVVPNAQATCFALCRDPEVLAGVRLRYQLPQRFVLALASASPRKNAPGLLRMYARLRPKLRQRYPLVIVWTHALLQPRVLQEMRRLGLSDEVHSLFQVPDHDLVLLYNAATAFLFPSLYEGFGLPVLEAMACGTPVVASNLTAIPEVAGDAAALADPRDERGFAATIADVLDSPDRQGALSEQGLERARQFTWERTARMTLSVYREAAGLAT